MKKNIVFIALIPSLLCACMKHDKPVDQTNQVKLLKYIFANMDEDVMPISGWVAPTSLVNLNTLEQYQILKESGLNCIYDLYEQYGVTLTRKDDQGVPHSYPAKDEIYKALDYASQVGIKYFVRDATLWNNQGEAFKNAFENREYTKYSGFGGFLYTDEPKTHEDFLRIASAREKFTQYVGDKYAFYVNLNPMQYFTSNGGDINDYRDYIKDYINTVKPTFLSYDHYALLGDSPFMKKDYFKNLSVVAEEAEAHDLSFWAFALASGLRFKNGTFYRSPNEEEIYWQVNTILAYGAKAVQYFCYQTPVGETPESNEFYIGQGGSIVNEKGEKTEIFPYIQKMNKYIAFIDHILMNSTKVGILAKELNPAVFLFESALNSCREVTSLESENNVICSVFDYKGKTALYIVNTSIISDSSFKVNFDKKHSFNTYSMDLEKTSLESTCYESSLKPGRAVLLTLD